MSKIIGMEELVRKLNALGDMKGQVMLDACVMGAREISNEAKIKAPKKTGTLFRSIHVGGHVAESAPDFSPSDVAGDYSDIGGEEVSDTKVTIQIGTNLVYAAPQEYGTSTGVPAHPYMRPAIDTKEQSCYKKIGEALKILIDKATK